jgi:hypothetical protein
MTAVTALFLVLSGVLPAGAATGSVPTITGFTAVPTKVVSGRPSTLAWSVKGATSLSISPGIGTVTGNSLIVNPTSTTTYTLTATNIYGSSWASVTVTAGPLPTISSFTATPAILTLGQTCTLNWTVSGATSLSIDYGVGTVTGTSVTVKPTVTTAYLLTASNTFGSVGAVVTVTVGTPPVITRFSASPASVLPGKSSILSWAVGGSPNLSISPGVGIVNGTSVLVTPSATTVYTMTATNPFGSVTATTTVTVGSPPTITSFQASPVKVPNGQPTILSWTVTGSPSLAITPNVGVVVGTSVVVTPSATTRYTLTATNPYGSATASVTVTTGILPVITSFTATPSTVTAGQSTTLSWTVTGAWGVNISPGVGVVQGSSFKVTPAGTTAYILTATDSIGSVTASTTVTVLPAGVPAINSFYANPAGVDPGQSTTLYWDSSGATSLSIGPGVGPVTGNSVVVSPGSATTYTLTASNGFGSVTASVWVGAVPLVRISDVLYYTEHVLFIVPDPSLVNFASSDSWASVYSTANVNSYVSTLKGIFPSDYFFVVVAANNLTPNNAPSVLLYRDLASGIGENSVQGVGVPNICQCNIGGAVTNSAFGMLSSEIGHNWGVFIGNEVGNPDWLADSTATGQLANTYSDDGYTTVKQISGDPVDGFTWTAVDYTTYVETETFSGQDLYLQGFGATFPTLYVLTSPVYNPDNSVSYSSVATYDQNWVVQQNGARNPSYQTSQKKLSMAFVYVARNLAEIQAVYQAVENSANNFANGEQIDTVNYPFEVPFLVDTQYRASVDALLADLDGNATPVLTIPGPTYLVSADGTAAVPFIATDADGPVPTVSCVPASANCSIQGSSVAISGLASGTYFFTIKAQATSGKKDFAHFVVDVQ